MNPAPGDGQPPSKRAHSTHEEHASVAAAAAATSTDPLDARARTFLAAHSQTLSELDAAEAAAAPPWPIAPLLEPPLPSLVDATLSPAALIVLLADLHNDDRAPLDVLYVNDYASLWPSLTDVAPGDLVAAAELGDYWQLPVTLVTQVHQEIAARHGIDDNGDMPRELGPLVGAAFYSISAATEFGQHCMGHLRLNGGLPFVRRITAGGERLELAAPQRMAGLYGMLGLPTATVSTEGEYLDYAHGASLAGRDPISPLEALTEGLDATAIQCAALAGNLFGVQQLVIQGVAGSDDRRHVEFLAALFGHTEVLEWAYARWGSWECAIRPGGVVPRVPWTAYAGVVDGFFPVQGFLNMGAARDHGEYLLSCATVGRSQTAVEWVLSKLEDPKAAMRSFCDNPLLASKPERVWLGETRLCTCPRHAPEVDPEGADECDECVLLRGEMERAQYWQYAGAGSL